MLAETKFGQGYLPDAQSPEPIGPTLLLKRLRDKTYIGFIAFQGDPLIQRNLVKFAQVLIDVLYSIPMKREPHWEVNE